MVRLAKAYAEGFGKRIKDTEAELRHLRFLLNKQKEYKRVPYEYVSTLDKKIQMAQERLKLLNELASKFS